MAQRPVSAAWESRMFVFLLSVVRFNLEFCLALWGGGSWSQRRRVVNSAAQDVCMYNGEGIT